MDFNEFNEFILNDEEKILKHINTMHDRYKLSTIDEQLIYSNHSISRLEQYNIIQFLKWFVTSNNGIKEINSQHEVKHNFIKHLTKYLSSSNNRKILLDEIQNNHKEVYALCLKYYKCSNNNYYIDIIYFMLGYVLLLGFDDKRRENRNARIHSLIDLKFPSNMESVMLYQLETFKFILIQFL